MGDGPARRDCQAAQGPPAAAGTPLEVTQLTLYRSDQELGKRHCWPLPGLSCILGSGLHRPAARPDGPDPPYSIQNPFQAESKPF